MYNSEVVNVIPGNTRLVLFTNSVRVHLTLHLLAYNKIQFHKKSPKAAVIY